MVLFEIILCIVVSGGASFESHPLLQNRDIPPLGYYSGRLTPPRDLHPYAYTEVDTPFYHYFFYAPAYKRSQLEDFLSSSYEDYVPIDKTLMLPEGNINIPGDLNPQYSSILGVEYQSPQFNDLGYDKHDISTNSPKLDSREFLDKPYSTAFKTQHTDQTFQSPTLSLNRSFLPTTLLSSTPNIVRPEGQGRVVHDGSLRPDSYARSFKHLSSNPVPEANIPPHKPVVNPSLYSSMGQNIIRDEVSSINKIFKPDLTYSKNYVTSSIQNSNNPSYPPQSIYPPSRGGHRYPTLTSMFPSVSPTLHSTNPPLLIEGREPFDNTPAEETLSPRFTSPFNDHTTPIHVVDQRPPPYGETSTVTPTGPRQFFEAPGRIQPKRR